MNKRLIATIAALSALLLPTTAFAYIGPGAGASLAGSLFGVLAAIAVAIGVVLFWPLRFVYKKIMGSKPAADVAEAETGETSENASTSAAE